MKIILLPIDFSEHASEAAGYGIEMFAKSQSRFILLNTWKPYSAGANSLITINDLIEDNANEKLNLEKESLLVKHNQIQLQMVAKAGDLVQAIRELHKEENFDLIVMGTKGATGLKEILIGSNTSAVIHKARIPVLVIPDGINFKPPLKIAFATDYRNFSDSVIDPLLQIARRFNSKIMIVNIQKDNRRIDTDYTQQKSRYSNLLDGIEHEFFTSRGADIAEGIDRFVHEQKADLFATIARKHSFFESIFHHSVTSQMALHTDIPLLALSDG